MRTYIATFMRWSCYKYNKFVYFVGKRPSVFCGWFAFKIYREELNICKNFIGHLKNTIWNLGIWFNLTCSKLSKGADAPFKPLSRRGHPSSVIPWCIFLKGAAPKKVITLSNNIIPTKTSVWGLNRTFIHYLRPKRVGVESAFFCVYMCKGLNNIRF
jgi:hypothetical protein